MTYHWLWATIGPALLPQTHRRERSSVGPEGHSFVLPRRVTVHLVQHPLNWIGGSRTYLATCSGCWLLVNSLDCQLAQRNDVSLDTLQGGGVLWGWLQPLRLF